VLEEEGLRCPEKSGRKNVDDWAKVLARRAWRQREEKGGHEDVDDQVEVLIRQGGLKQEVGDEPSRASPKGQASERCDGGARQRRRRKRKGESRSDSMQQHGSSNCQRQS